MWFVGDIKPLLWCINECFGFTDNQFPPKPVQQCN